MPQQLLADERLRHGNSNPCPGNAADILASAKDINQARMAQEEEIMEDTSETTTSSEA